MNYKLIFLILMGMTSLIAKAQTDDEEITNMFFNEDSENDLSQITEQLSYYREQPISIRLKNIKELEDLYLLNSIQLEALQEHIQLYGELISIYELQAIDHFDLKSIYKILPYVYVETSSSTQFDASKVRTEIRYQVSERTHDPNRNKYKGSMMRHYLRIRTEQSGFGGISLAGEKDSGEEFFKGSNAKGFDHLSGNIHFYKRAFFETIILGDFQVGFGQGLLINQGRTAGTSIEMLSMKRSGKVFQAYSSAMEINYNRGIALSMQFNKLCIHTFYANTPMDKGSGMGLHRTDLEISKKHGIRKKMSGIGITYNRNRFHIGVHHVKEQAIHIPEQAFAMDYSFGKNNMLWYGEIALYKNAWAYVQGLMFIPANGLTLSMLYRNYASNYNATYSSAYGENSTNENEQGLFWGANYRLNSRINIGQHIDVFKFPRNQFRIAKASYGYTTNSQFHYLLRKRQTLIIRIRYKEKFRDEKKPEYQLINIILTKRFAFRITYDYKINENWFLKCSYELVRFKSEFENRKGSFCIQEIKYKPMGKAISMNAGYRISNIEDYDARIYVYESDLPGAFAMPVVNEIGYRFYFNAHYKINKRYGIAIKYAYSNTSSSGFYEYKAQAYLKL